MQLPSNILDKAFSEIDVNEKGGKLEIFYSIMGDLRGEMAEGWETGIAVDASVSMKEAFGKRLVGTVPEDAVKKYKKKGWVETKHQDGNKVTIYYQKAHEDAIKRGYLSPTNNIVEPEARKFSSYLADNLDEDGGTDIIYWACGKDGKNIEEFGELDSNSCNSMKFIGPVKQNWGEATHLLPAVEYFEKKYLTAKRCLFVFITDGHLDDLADVKKFTVKLAKVIEAGKRNPFKAILIGIGKEIDEGQMIELDDLDTGTDIDIWDHKIAAEMKDIMEIFAEIVDEKTIVAPLGTIYDSNGTVVKKFNDGVPAKGYFNLPLNSDSFTFKVGDQTINQEIRR